MGEAKQELIAYLSELVTEARREKIKSVLQQRTRRVTVILEDIYQPHNASAVLRSCDSFGVQDVHIVENRNAFTVSHGVTLGSDRWLTLSRYNEEKINNTERCLDKLKADGYTIVATTLHQQEVKIDELAADKKLALMFGSEISGLSEFAVERADICAKIPMQGFSESFNISVSAALCLYEVTNRLRQQDLNWSLSEEEKLDLEISWLRQSIRGGELVEKRFFEEKLSS